MDGFATCRINTETGETWRLVHAEKWERVNEPDLRKCYGCGFEVHPEDDVNKLSPMAVNERWHYQCWVQYVRYAALTQPALNLGTVPDADRKVTGE